jgi:hypothetical protein
MVNCATSYFGVDKTDWYENNVTYGCNLASKNLNKEESNKKV